PLLDHLALARGRVITPCITPGHYCNSEAAGNVPICREDARADARTRTGDPFITSEVLYQLSYVGVCRYFPELPQPRSTSWAARGLQNPGRSLLLARVTDAGR